MAELQPSKYLPSLSVDSTYKVGLDSNEPSTPQTAYHSSRDVSLDQAWAKAQQRFEYKTSTSLKKGQSKKTLHEILSQWQEMYDDSNTEKARKSQEMVGILDTILSGIELVGAFAVQMVSNVFAPAGMCFNAVEILLKLPRTISKFYDTLRNLFEEVAAFLVKFKILKRIDDRTKLDPELIVTTNHLLIAFVDICAETIPLIKGHSIQMAFKVGFLQSDPGVSKALDNFKDLSRRHDSLSNAIQLESVLESKEISGHILTTIQSITATTHDQRTLQINKDRLDEITPRLFTTEERRTPITSQRVVARATPLPGTLDVLAETPEYRHWYENLESEREFLFLSGLQNTGKTSVLEAVHDRLKDKLNSNDLVRGDSSIYVASHAFIADGVASDGSNERRRMTSIAFALKSLAYQVAEQSVRYSNFLLTQLKTRKELKIVEKIPELWDLLQLCHFGAPENSLMYLLFDGLDRASEASVKALIKVLAGDKRRRIGQGQVSREPHKFKLKLRIFVTCDTEVLNSLERRFPFVNMNDCNTALIRSFTELALKRADVFQDDDPKSIEYRDTVLSEMPGKASGSFAIVLQKVELLRQALERDASTEELADIMNDEKNVDVNEEGRSILEELEAKLTPQHIQQLNSILKWVVYGGDAGSEFNISGIEAFLLLEREHLTLEPLAKKIKTRFSKILAIEDGYVHVCDTVYHALRAMEDETRSSPSSNARTISMNITIQNVTETVIRQFFWDVNEQLTSGKFDLGNPFTDSPTTKINVNKLDGHLSLARTYLKLLGEEPQVETKDLIASALVCLPIHLKQLRDMQGLLSLVDRVLIVQGLVGLFSDSYNIEQHLEFAAAGMRSSWFDDELENVRSMRGWFDDPEIVSHLQPNERRWIKQAASPSSGHVGFLRQFAVGLSRIFCRRDGNPSCAFPIFLWLEGYVDAMKLSTNSSEAESKRSFNEPPSSSAQAEDEGKKPESLEERVRGVMKWAQENSGIEHNAVTSFQIGNVYMSISNPSLAVRSYDAAVEKGLDGWRLSRARALAYWTMENKDQAIAYMSGALRQENTAVDDPWTAVPNIQFKEMSDDLGRWYVESNRHCEAIPVYQELLKRAPDDDQCRWEIFHLYCATDQTEAAAAFLTEWLEHPRKHGSRGPPLSFLELTKRNYDCVKQETMIRAVRDNKLRLLLAEILGEATQLADLDTKVHCPNAITYLQGVALADGDDPADTNEALQCFQRALYLQLSSTHYGSDFDIPLGKAANRASLHAFNVVYREFRTVPDLSLERKNHLAEQLEREVDNLLDDMWRRIHTVYYSVYRSPRTYVSSFYALIGQSDRARAIMRPDVADAIAILTDNDPDNDQQGIDLLLAALRFAGDYVGALTLFSLLDRQTVPAKPDSTAIASQSRESENTSNTSIRGYISMLDYTCNGCEKDWVTSAEGMLSCKFCYDIDFCHDCYAKLRQGALPRGLCDADHDFLHLYHTEYSDEERAPGKVRIDWEMERGPNFTFTRKGGRIVDIDEWIEQLRMQWDVPKVESDVRAQK